MPRQPRRDPAPPNVPASMPVQVQLLDGFAITIGARAIPASAWRLQRAAHLIKLLALAPGARLGRETVEELLWPEAEPGAAARNLYNVVYVARQLLASPDSGIAAQDILQLRGPTLALAPHLPLSIDVVAFEAAAVQARRSGEPADYSAALALYTGELLPEDRYEDWAAARRETLRSLQIALLQDLARLYEARGAADLALAAWERIVTTETAHEEAHVALMRLFAATGQRHLALRQWTRLQEALRRDLDAEPGATSQAVYRDILRGAIAPTASPAPTPAPARPAHNLPTPLTTFIGRTRERAELRAAFERGARNAERGTRLAESPESSPSTDQIPRSALRVPRLLTLTGPGGCGKTRLALAVAHDLVQVFADGVWLVELASLTEPTLVAGAVATVLGVREEGNRPPTEALIETLRGRALLLVLDNCEHQLDTCAQLAVTLLERCPGVRVLATSRAPLQVAGETVWPVPALGIPPGGPGVAVGRDSGAHDLATLALVDSVALLIDRARLRQPTFSLTPDNADALVSICHRLDGIPLALELAAARLAHLPPEQVAARLNAALTILTTGSRAAPTRQQSLRATLDWSHALLDAAERTALRRLAPFAGGCGLPAAEAVCGEEGTDLPPLAILDLLTSLADRSLIAVEHGPTEVRYHLLETVRQYAAERLAASAEEGATRERHAAYFLACAEEAARHLRGAEQARWLARLDRERDNLRAAWAWLAARDDAERATRLGGALWWYWYVRGQLTEGREVLTAALALGGHGDGAATSDQARATALLGAGVLAWRQGDLDPARAQCEESVALARGLGDRGLLGWAMVFLSHIYGAQHEFAAARAGAEEALACFRAVGDQAGLARVLNGLGEDARFSGDYARAATLYEECLALNRALGDIVGIALGLHNLGYVALHHKDAGRAATLFEESLTLSQTLDHDLIVGLCLTGFAGVAVLLGRPTEAARLYGAAETLRAASGEADDVVDAIENERYLGEMRSQLTPAAFASALEAGHATGVGAAITLAREVARNAGG